MNDAGYTLTEMLAAMLVIGLAVGSLAFGVEVLGARQLATGKVMKQVQSLRAARQTLEQLLALGAPFGSQQPDHLSGDSGQFHFRCGATTSCGAQILTNGAGRQLQVVAGGTPARTVVLPLVGTARFAYRSLTATSDIWPPAAPGAQALRSIILFQTTGAGEAPLVEARVWPEQAAQCDFDPVMQACR